LKYPEEFPKEKLVYLTADSENLVTNLDPADIFLIGGIVDHNRHKLLTLNKATAQGIRHARLPIRECGVKLSTSCVLTVNHVVDIIGRYLTLTDYGKGIG
jgi:tRNA (guanine9-N1)-methyltransferase